MINAQTTTIDESDDIIIESCIGPSSKGPGKGVKISAEFYKYATDKIKKEKLKKSSSKRKYEGQNKAKARSSSFKTKSKN